MLDDDGIINDVLNGKKQIEEEEIEVRMENLMPSTSVLLRYYGQLSFKELFSADGLLMLQEVIKSLKGTPCLTSTVFTDPVSNNITLFQITLSQTLH